MTATTQRTLNVLLVDDSDDHALMIQMAFDAKADLQLHHVLEDGDLVMAYLRNEDTPLPGLILMDINMPRKNGFEVLKEIKDDPELCHLPVVMLSTSSLDKDVAEAYRLRANSYICKPEDIRGFHDLVDGLHAYWLRVALTPEGKRAGE